MSLGWSTYGLASDGDMAPWWQSWWLWVAAFAVLASLVTWYVGGRLRRAKRERAMQRALSRRLLEAQESERKRIAAELHDGLGQDLLVIKNRALLGLQEAAATSRSVEQFEEISRMAGSSLAEVREISHALRPYLLDRLGLTKALQAMVSSVSSASGLKCEAQLEPLDGVLGAAMEIHFYRIAQELLNNVVKHSHASQAKVSAKAQAGKITLVVADDGCGFNPVAVQEGADGVGLGDIAERVGLLEGTIECDSQRAKGTRWTIVVPVRRESWP